MPHRTLITIGPHGFLARRLLEQYPELTRALEAAGASLVVFWVPTDYLAEEEGREIDVEVAARAALEQAEAGLPEDDGVPIFVCECAAYSLRTLLFPAVPKRIVSGVELPLGLHPRRGVFGGVLALGEGGVLVFDAGGRRLHGWDEPRDALLERIRTLREAPEATGARGSPR